MQVDLTGNEDADDSELPCDVQALPSVPGEGDAGFDLAAPAARLPQPYVAENERASITKADACHGCSHAGEASQADALGKYERKAANQADEAIDDENDDVPDETRGSSQRIAPGQIIDAQRRYDCEGGKRGIPAQSAPP